MNEELNFIIDIDEVFAFFPALSLNHTHYSVHLEHISAWTSHTSSAPQPHVAGARAARSLLSQDTAL